ncbi:MULTISPECIES: hypothetical protein [unclassified Streptomyces]|uniref:hypothetical protein n=1 Tax=unclassified Streptomyces TaxID=2593676 RepID=UPI0036E8BFEB
MRRLSVIGSVRRVLGRILPDGLSSGSAAGLAAFDRHGEYASAGSRSCSLSGRSVTSRHVAHLAARA